MRIWGLGAGQEQHKCGAGVQRLASIVQGKSWQRTASRLGELPYNSTGRNNIVGVVEAEGGELGGGEVWRFLFGRASQAAIKYLSLKNPSILIIPMICPNTNTMVYF